MIAAARVRLPAQFRLCAVWPSQIVATRRYESDGRHIMLTPVRSIPWRPSTTRAVPRGLVGPRGVDASIFPAIQCANVPIDRRPGLACQNKPSTSRNPADRTRRSWSVN